MDANDAAANAGIGGAFQENTERAELGRALAAMGGPEFRYRSFAQSPSAVTVQGTMMGQIGPDPSQDLAAPGTLTAVQEAPRRATPVHTPVPGALSQFPLFASALAEASDVAVTSGISGAMTPMAAPGPGLAPAVAMMTAGAAPPAQPAPAPAPIAPAPQAAAPAPMSQGTTAPPPPAAWPAPVWGAPPQAAPADPAPAAPARSVPLNEVFRMLAPNGGVAQPSPSSPLRDMFRRLT